MNRERFEYMYLLFGLFCGFLLGSSIGLEWAIIVRRLLYAGAILFVAFSWRWLESKSHMRHLEFWEEIEPRGKWHFIFTRYILLRGSALAVLFIGPVLTTLRATASSITMLGVSGAILFATLAFLGSEEWKECDQEIQILALRQTGEFIVSQQN